MGTPVPRVQVRHGVIPKSAIKKFLDRDRNDCRDRMKWSNEELDERAEELTPKPPVWWKLRRHQKVCLLLGVRYHKFAFWLDTGAGKSLLSISLAWYFRKSANLKQALVLVPNRVNTGAWRAEVRKHAPQTNCRILRGTNEEKWAKLAQGESLITVVTYLGFLRMISDKKTVKRKARGKTKEVVRLVINRTKLKRVMKQFGMLVMDESTAIGYRDSLYFQMCRAMAKEMPYVFALSGTPFGRDPLLLWTQMYLIDHGYSLGETQGLFRASFYSARDNFWGGTEYTFLKKNMGTLHRFLAHRSIEYEADNLDLPQMVSLQIKVDLPLDVQQYIDIAKAEMKRAKGNFLATKNAFLRMRQISSGFLGFKDDDDGARASLVFPTQPKLDALMSLIESIRPDYKIVVFHTFRFSGGMICKRLDEEKIGYAAVHGGTKHPEDELDRFASDEQCRVFVVNDQSGAYGLNLQMARYVIYYESPVSPILRKQTRRRVERQGSEYKRVFVYDMIASGTYDERILEFLKQGKDLFDGIIRGEFST